MGEGRRFEINKPSTAEDDGAPSNSCLEDIERVFRFIDDERHLMAQGIYHDVLGRLQEWRAEASSPSSSNSSSKNKFRLLRKGGAKGSKVKAEQVMDMQAAQDLIDNKQALLEDLDVSCLLVGRRCNFFRSTFGSWELMIIISCWIT